MPQYTEGTDPDDPGRSWGIPDNGEDRGVKRTWYSTSHPYLTRYNASGGGATRKPPGVSNIKKGRH